MAKGIGSDKTCPLASPLGSYLHCMDNCEWNDGEGCAIWRIIKALEKLTTVIHEG